MIRVRCQQSVTIDDKGRLALPAPIRRSLEEAQLRSLVLAFSLGSVWGWTPAHYEQQIESKMLSQDPFSTDVLDFAHSTMSTAQDVELDGQGRIRIPQPLRELAGLEKDCMVHVILGHLEIWDKGAWDRRFQESLHRVRHQSGMPGGSK